MELVRFGTEVALEMEDRREDDYEQNKVLANNELIPNKFQPKPVFKAYTGSGNRLGSSEPGPSIPAPKAPEKESLVNIDESKSKTKLRFRLASGKQLVQGSSLLVIDKLNKLFRVQSRSYNSRV